MSSYVDDELYERLRAFAADSTKLGRSDFGSLRTEVEPLILHEARLLDDGRYREWLDLLTEEAIYWIPLSRFDDPATTWSIAFDDRFSRTGRWPGAWSADRARGWRAGQLPTRPRS